MSKAENIRRDSKVLARVAELRKIYASTRHHNIQFGAVRCLETECLYTYRFYSGKSEYFKVSGLVIDGHRESEKYSDIETLEEYYAVLLRHDENLTT